MVAQTDENKKGAPRGVVRLWVRPPVRPCAYLMKNRFPRIRFVALSTASAAPRAESVSAR